MNFFSCAQINKTRSMKSATYIFLLRVFTVYCDQSTVIIYATNLTPGAVITQSMTSHLDFFEDLTNRCHLFPLISMQAVNHDSTLKYNAGTCSGCKRNKQFLKTPSLCHYSYPLLIICICIAHWKVSFIPVAHSVGLSHSPASRPTFEPAIARANRKQMS